MDMVYRLGWTLLHSLWEGAAIAAILAVVLAFIPRRAAQARYLCLIIAMLAMVTALAGTLVVSPTPGHTISEPSPSPVPASSFLMETRLAPASETPSPTQAIAPAVSIRRQIDDRIDAVSPMAARLWFAGVMLIAIWRCAAWISVQRLRVVKTEPADAVILQTASRLADRLNLRTSFEIVVSHFTETPLVIGWLRPVILIPASAVAGLSAHQLEMILAHELAHIRRHDYLVNLLQILAETLLFYHPAVWWISRQIRLEREQACDDMAVSVCGDRHAYARSLAALEELRVVGFPAMAANGSGGGQMLVRIRRILRVADDAPRWRHLRIVCVVAIAAAAVALFSCSKAVSTGTTSSDRVSAATQPFSLKNDAPRRSPFTAVRWRGDVAEAQFQATWYEVVSINDVPVEKMMAYLTQSNDFAPRKHFAEDLVEVMRGMGSEPGQTVKLELRTLDTKQMVTIPDAAMTEENRKSVLKSASGEAPGTSLPVSTGDVFKFDVPFKLGKSQFLDGDQITVTSVKGTSADMESGICCVSGTYKVSTHDHAMLAAFVTAADARDAMGYYNAAQTMSVKKGSGTFTLLLPVSIRGWPHVSFYGDAETGQVEGDELVNLKKIDYTNQDLATQEAALAFKRKELDSLGEKFGTTDLQPRDQEMQANLVRLEEQLTKGKIDLNAAKAAGLDKSVDVATLSEHINGLTKLVDETRKQASEVGSQRQQIEDVRAEIAQIQQHRDRDLRTLEALNAQQMLIKGTARGRQGSFGESYIGTGGWVLAQ